MAVPLTLQFIVFCTPIYFYPRLSLAPNTALFSWSKEMVIVKWVTPGTQILRHVVGGILFVSLTLCKQPRGTVAGNTVHIHYHLATFQFVIRIYQHTESYRLLPCHVAKRLDSLSQLLSLSLFSAFLSIVLHSLQLSSSFKFYAPFFTLSIPIFLI